MGESKFCPECGVEVSSSPAKEAENPEDNNSYYEALKKIEEDKKAEQKV